MVANAGLKLDLGAVASEVARALSHAEVQGNAAFVSTAVSYPNGTSCVVRIDEDPDGYFVSDDGYGAFTAETMGGLPSFNKVAQISAQRWGVKFDHRSFFVLHVSREQLAGAVVAIANTSVSAVERTVYAMDAIRIRRLLASVKLLAKEHDLTLMSVADLGLGSSTRLLKRRNESAL